jgi:hypothetical protein
MTVKPHPWPHQKWRQLVIDRIHEADVGQGGKGEGQDSCPGGDDHELLKHAGSLQRVSTSLVDMDDRDGEYHDRKRIQMPHSR